MALGYEIGGTELGIARRKGYGLDAQGLDADTFLQDTTFLLHRG